MTTLERDDQSTGSISLRKILHPPVNELPFWIVQATVLVIVSIHYLLDVKPSVVSATFPTGVPVALLVIPIGYAALRYGLAGSSATATWTIVLWLPDLMLPHDEGHVGDDVMNLAIVLLVAFLFGRSVEAQRLTQRRADAASARTLAAEAGYHQLFESNRSPILVIDESNFVSDANPAARSLLGASVVGRSSHHVIGDLDLEAHAGEVLTLNDGHDYRLDVVTMPLGSSALRHQVNFEDVTEERADERRARHFAQRVVAVEEDQRRRLARELHDEPLQLFLHLARRLEILSTHAAVPADVTTGLTEARRQALDAAAKLRTVARDLRPPALDELGLVPALSSLIADADADAESLDVRLVLEGPSTRLAPDVELAAFRIVQESLRNARRHGAARHVRVKVTFERKALHLEVSDDGVGFDVDQHVRRSSLEGATSLGILGMRERARLLGGTLRVDSQRGAGTAVSAVLPFEVPTRDITNWTEQDPSNVSMFVTPKN